VDSGALICPSKRFCRRLEVDASLNRHRFERSGGNDTRMGDGADRAIVSSRLGVNVSDLDGGGEEDEADTQNTESLRDPRPLRMKLQRHDSTRQKTFRFYRIGA